MQPNEGLLGDLEWLKQLEPSEFFEQFGSCFRLRETDTNKNPAKLETGGRVVINLRHKFDEQYKNANSLASGGQTPKLLMAKHLIPFFKDKTNMMGTNGSMLGTNQRQVDKENRNPNIMHAEQEQSKQKRTVLRKREKESPPGNSKLELSKDPRSGSVGELRIDTNPDWGRLDDSLHRATRVQELSVNQSMRRSPLGRTTPTNQYFPLRRGDTHKYNTEHSLDNLMHGHGTNQAGGLSNLHVGHSSSSQLQHLGWGTSHSQLQQQSNSFLLRKLIRETNLSTLANNPTTGQPHSSRSGMGGNPSREGLRQMLGLVSKTSKARDAGKGRSFVRGWDDCKEGSLGLLRKQSSKEVLGAAGREGSRAADGKGSKTSLLSEGSQLGNLFLAPRVLTEYSAIGIDEPSSLNQRCNLLRAVLPSVGRSEVPNSHLGAFINPDHYPKRTIDAGANREPDFLNEGLAKSKNHRSYSSIGANGFGQITSTAASEAQNGTVSHREPKQLQHNGSANFSTMVSSKQSRISEGVNKRSLDYIGILDRQTHPHLNKAGSMSSSRAYPNGRADEPNFDLPTNTRKSLLAGAAADTNSAQMHIPTTSEARTTTRDQHVKKPSIDLVFQAPKPSPTEAEFVFITDEQRLVNNVQDVTNIERILSKAKAYGEKIFQRTNSNRHVETQPSLEAHTIHQQVAYQSSQPRPKVATGSVDLGTKGIRYQQEQEVSENLKKSRLKTQVQELLSSKSKQLLSGDRYASKHLLWGDLMHQGSHSNALREKANKILYGDKYSKESSLDRHPSGVWSRPPQDKPKMNKPDKQPAPSKPQPRSLVNSVFPAKLLMRM